jgi:hypothetical protein
MTNAGMLANMIYGIACLVSGFVALCVAVLFFHSGATANELQGIFLLLAAAIWFVGRLIRYVLTGR